VSGLERPQLIAFGLILARRSQL